MDNHDGLTDEKRFISAINIVSDLVSEVNPSNDEQRFLLRYYNRKLQETGVSKDDKLYIYIMLLNNFKEETLKRVLVSESIDKKTKDRWLLFCQSKGLDRLISQHLNFDTTPPQLVNEAFLLWITL